MDFVDFHKAQQDKLEKDFVGHTNYSNTDLLHKVTSNVKLKKKTK